MVLMALKDPLYHWAWDLRIPAFLSASMLGLAVVCKWPSQEMALLGDLALSEEVCLIFAQGLSNSEESLLLVSSVSSWLLSDHDVEVLVTHVCLWVAMFLAMMIMVWSPDTVSQAQSNVLFKSCLVIVSLHSNTTLTRTEFERWALNCFCLHAFSQPPWTL